MNVELSEQEIELIVMKLNASEGKEEELYLRLKGLLEALAVQYGF